MKNIFGLKFLTKNQHHKLFVALFNISCVQIILNYICRNVKFIIKKKKKRRRLTDLLSNLLIKSYIELDNKHIWLCYSSFSEFSRYILKKCWWDIFSWKICYLYRSFWWFRRFLDARLKFFSTIIWAVVFHQYHSTKLDYTSMSLCRFEIP